MPVMLPDQDIFTSKKPDYYKPQDFYIGACLNLQDFKFEITSADIYGLRYMELHCEKVREIYTLFYAKSIDSHFCKSLM
jgi:hypothetical protein